MFSVLFTENLGSTAVYSQIRRFIVVKQRREFCFACPVFTYGGRATLKPGVEADEHAIVYTVGQQPTKLEGEAEFEKLPIGVLPPTSNDAYTGHPLDPASRIYFVIFHAIQYNVKVKDMGKVRPEDLSRLRGYWQMELNK
ncbi:hypothetical protein K469DRAFT_741647 [Zopfia rhizophila CBS 207.26]|uniref:DUF6590 domain-containing protein n=1 Tax=Zopfia rhizophila CBS 207.26 TaxID=1314779 RepID=A0A6A6DM00_9PEZI|nr:hypothetical protein K469DRAFT_741647 [Zopfia rhizophila CBS 207.26]